MGRMGVGAGGRWRVDLCNHPLPAVTSGNLLDLSGFTFPGCHEGLVYVGSWHMWVLSRERLCPGAMWFWACRREALLTALCTWL